MPLWCVRHVFALHPLTVDVVTALNAELSLPALAKDIAEIGYPTSGASTGNGV